MILSVRKKDIIFFILSAILGLASFIIPVILTPRIGYYDSPLFPIVRTGVEKLSFFEVCCLAISGFILSFLNPRKPWRWGLATMSLFPILAIIEMIADSRSHNLWPMEFLMYGILTIPGILGAFAGASIRKKLKKS